MREGRCKAVSWARVMKIEPWLLGYSSESCSPPPRPQLHLMVCSCFNVWPRAKFMWQHQQKEENSKDIKDRARLIYISLNFPLPLQEEKARNIKECHGRERVEKEKHLSYSFESIKGSLKVRLNVLNSPVSGSSASSLLHRAPNSYKDRRTSNKDALIHRKGQGPFKTYLCVWKDEKFFLLQFF